MKRLLLCFALATLTPTSVFATQIYGTVTFGKQNHRVEKIEVQLLDSDEKVVARVKTDKKGYYAFKAGSGSYSIKIIYKDKKPNLIDLVIEGGKNRVDLNFEIDGDKLKVKRK